jgi:lipoate-protein ligase A
MNVKQEEIKEMILQFPVEEINELIEEIRKALEIKEFMKLAETGFAEWNDPEEDIYNNETEN